MTSEMILFALIALNALTFSRIEHWTYLEGEKTQQAERSTLIYEILFLAHRNLLFRRVTFVDWIWRCVYLVD